MRSLDTTSSVQKNRHRTSRMLKMCSLCSAATHLCLAIFIISSLQEAGGNSSSSSPRHNEVMVLEGQEADLPCVTTPSQDQATPTGSGGGGLQQYLMSPQGSSLQDQQHQRVLLIAWYKDGLHSSLYSYDGRQPGRERHWSQRRSLGGALNLSVPSGPEARPQLAFLRISHAHHTDAGLYRCRVDFARSPSRITLTRLSIVAPPATPTVEVWAGGRWLRTAQETPAASVEVGTALRLRCSAAGGRPAPEVTWWRGGQQLLGEVTIQSDLVISKVNVSVRPEDANTPIVCQAANTHLSPPRRTPLQLLILSSPSWVRVAGADTPMSVGGSYMVECRSKGAVPPPVLTWSVAGQGQDFALSTTDSKGETVSRLSYQPRPEHAGAHLTCTARPPDHAHSPYTTPNIWVKSDSVPLNILYKPEVLLELQRLRPSSEHGRGASRPPPFSPSVHKSQNLIPPSKTSTTKATTLQKDSKKTPGASDGRNPNDVSLVEGEEVVLQCQVRANPPAYHVSWYRDGKPLSPDRSQGLVVGNMSVVLRHLKRHNAGNYSCAAHNTQGSSRSNPVLLHVTHGPECLRDTPQVLGVPRHHPLNVTCQVAAHPPPTAFSWALKSSRGLLQVPAEMITSLGTTSWISYTPRAAVDYGELLCWAHTPAGRQRRPCVARLVPADKPDPPEHCAASRRTLHTITVSCTAAHDGGLPQTFFMRVFQSGHEVANGTSVTSHITVYDLEPNTRYRLTLWSANTHGTSRSISLYATTAPTNTSSASSSMNGHSSSSVRGPLAALGPSLLAVVVVVSVLGLVLGVVLGILTQRIAVPDRSNNQDLDDEEQPQPQPQPQPRTTVATTRMTEGPRRSRAPRGRLGRGKPGVTGGPRQTPSARCDVVKVPGRQQNSHVYADPIALRRKSRAHQPTPEDITDVIIHNNNNNNNRPTFSVTNPHLPPHQPQSLLWHLPNSRLLRNKIDLKFPQKEVHRKAVKVEPPKLPTLDMCPTVNPMTRTTALPSLELRLILIPETSKMLKYALERDTRLVPYLPKESSLSSSSSSKFPTINEEEEYKPLGTTQHRTSSSSSSSTTVTPYEIIPVHRTPGPDTDADRRAKNTTLGPILEHPVEAADNLVPQDPPQHIPCTINEAPSARIAVGNNSDNHSTRKETDNVVCDCSSSNNSSSSSRNQEIQTTSTAETNTTPHRVSHGERQPTEPYNTNLSVSRDPQQQHLHLHNLGMKVRRNSIPNNRSSSRARLSPYDYLHRPAIMNHLLLPWTPEIQVPAGAPGRSVPSMPLLGNLNRHQPYGTPLACLTRGLQTPTATPTRRQTEPLIVPVGGSSPQTTTPSSSYSGLRRPRFGLTSLFSLSSSASSSSSSTSSSSSSSSSPAISSPSPCSYLSRWGKRSAGGDATPSPFADIKRRDGRSLLKRSPQRSLFGSRTSRPHSVHAVAAAAAASSCTSCGPEHVLQCYTDADHLSSSTPSSPRSSSSSSSCFPHSSSSSSSSPVSSFYSSENSLSISASLSQSSSSSSSFQFSSSSSSASSSSSPLSSFLSPSLTSPSSSSVLSLSSCSTTQDSILSGQVTPT